MHLYWQFHAQVELNELNVWVGRRSLPPSVSLCSLNERYIKALVSWPDNRVYRVGDYRNLDMENCFICLRISRATKINTKASTCEYVHMYECTWIYDI